ncbi:Diacylglycerol kinase [Basidiobolus ranarum]|uniref:Diacylglycerol kinase n=1 Tax=Basidiobolus ranarum TaxID=34480 RepID=A0ABR2X2A5_9FUNG
MATWTSQETKQRKKQSGKIQNKKTVAVKDDVKTESRDWEIPRKLLHMSNGLICFLLYELRVPVSQVVYGLILYLCIAFGADIIRFLFPSFNRLYIKVVGFLMRKEEETQVNGVVYFLVGGIIALYFFPRDIALVSIIILSWCDPAASIFGRLWGRYTYRFSNGKSVAGFCGSWLVGSMVTYFFWGYCVHKNEDFSWQTGAAIPLWALSIIGGSLGAVTELVDIQGIDDNFRIPVLVSLGFWIVLVVFGLGMAPVTL